MQEVANRRMFSLDVVDTDKFLEMPATSQNLYFHLGMRADDDGFVASPKKITKLVNCGNDDLNVLISRGFVIALDDGIVVIRHWRQNNYIQSDRYKKTIYQNELACLTVNNGIYDKDTSCIQTVTNLEAQDSIGKNSIDKVSIDYQLIADMYNDTCVSYPKLTRLSDRRKKAIKARFNQGYSLQDFKRLFGMAEGSSFLKGGNSRNWSANFDWLVADANMAKVLDGNYQDRQNKGGGDPRGNGSQGWGKAADFYEQFLGAGDSDQGGGGQNGDTQRADGLPPV